MFRSTRYKAAVACYDKEFIIGDSGPSRMADIKAVTLV